VDPFSDRVPRFSVLLPTHNRSHLLPFAIRSVLAQTESDFELLVVGDGCTDHTARVVHSFADPRIRWFDLPKASGFGYANRNIALRQARGTFIAFLSDDDVWFPDHLESLGPCFEEPRVELVYSRPLWVVESEWMVPGTFNLNHAPTLEAFLAKKANGVPAGCVIHRRECFDRYGYWDERLASLGDWDLWARIIDGGGRENVVMVSDPSCLHFRAPWRTEAVVVAQLGPDWEPFHALGSSIPSALQIRSSEAALPQGAVWQAMSAAPNEWQAQVRAGVRRVLDWRVSRGDRTISEHHQESAMHARRIQDLERSLSEHQHQARVLIEELQSIKGSTAWRVARWIGSLRARRTGR
jgi:glycosyltransferase involved in cell wall biosynthesis